MRTFLRITAFIVLLAILTLTAVSCYSMNDEDEYLCEGCGEPCSDRWKIHRGFLCDRCAVGTRECRGCGILYFFEGESNSHLIDDTGSEHYCEACMDSHIAECAFCWIEPIEKERMVSFIIDGNLQYMCTSCAESYLRNVSSLSPCFWCYECMEILSEISVDHFPCAGTIDEKVCADCVRKCGYLPCSKCKQYTDHMNDGLCMECYYGYEQCEKCRYYFNDLIDGLCESCIGENT